MAAMYYGNDLVKLLLEYGADVTQTNKDGKNVLDILGPISTYPTVQAVYQPFYDLCMEYIDINRPKDKPVLK